MSLRAFGCMSESILHRENWYVVASGKTSALNDAPERTIYLTFQFNIVFILICIFAFKMEHLIFIQGKLMQLLLLLLLDAEHRTVNKMGKREQHKQPKNYWPVYINLIMLLLGLINLKQNVAVYVRTKGLLCRTRIDKFCSCIMPSLWPIEKINQIDYINNFEIYCENM